MRDVRRRDRRGRGPRGPVLPAELPGAASRAEAFEDLVLAAFDRLARRWPAELAAVAAVVEEVPPAGASRETALSRAEPATLDLPARVVVHRRPVEARAKGLRAREDLVHDAVVEAVSDLLGIPPEQVDPDHE